MPEDPRATAILDFWLGEVGRDGWYEADAARDTTIRERFGAMFDDAIAGRLGPWIRQHRECLALLILLDQFSRNIHRGDPRAFGGDARALSIASLSISLGHDLRIAMPDRQFFYLPFMHSERLADQERCVRLFVLNGQNDPGDNLEHAIKHRAVIRRFGRFPSRNAVLGRRDSAKELSYRAEGGYMA
ncbi:MAG: DUF924 family protein [Pseudomonadota bacterium]